MSKTIRPDHLGCDAIAAAKNLLVNARRVIAPRQREVVATLPPEVRHVVGFHLGWWGADGSAMPGSRGKAIRPALSLCSAHAAGGSEQAAVPAAVAVELIHDFSLLHDDIMDGDLMRRHRPTAWAEFGVPRALLTGDALVILAFELVSEGSSGAALRASVLELCAGQSDDLAFENRAEVGLDECLRMAERKTGALFGVACQLGTLSVVDDIRLAGLYEQFGRELGIAFQLIDDIVGIWGSESAIGKPVFSDLRSRKKSLPVVAALSSSTEAGRELAEFYSTDRVLDERDLARAADLIEDAGGRAWAEAEAVRHRSIALDKLASANPDPRASADLYALAEFVTAQVP